MFSSFCAAAASGSASSKRTVATGTHIFFLVGELLCGHCMRSQESRLVGFSSVGNLLVVSHSNSGRKGFGGLNKTVALHVGSYINLLEPL